IIYYLAAYTFMNLGAFGIASMIESEEYPLIIDALLGSGFTGELKEPYKSIVDKVNSVKSVKAAIDIPTGLDADKGFGTAIYNADYTISLGELKRGLFFGRGKVNSGIIKKGGIGIDASYFRDIATEAFLIESSDIPRMLPERKIDAHKYSAGKTLIVAGSGKYPGAAALVSKAAFAAGSGSVILCAPEAVKTDIFSSLAEVVVHSYDHEFLTPQDIPALEQRLSWMNALAIGPGLDREPQTIEAVTEIMKHCADKNVIIDADAIFALGSAGYKKITLKNKILTPHIGEFSHLINIPVDELTRDITRFGSEFSRETGCILVLKGAPSIVFSPDGKYYINSTGNSGMAKFGMGDALTGILSGLAAQGADPLDAAISGVYLHSLSADLLLNEHHINTITANLVIDNFSQALKYVITKTSNISS
ncbi:MAG TPA: NAD(P)H-hydrate dehydratase, partial [Ignavibacteriales bacterium]|nr:NAD(P)H-hydrate dehydratase [Ignavibacteriales bacterium]